MGSFLNVVGLRFNSGLTLKGRSICPSCGKKLHWWELLPFLSFFILRGRCRQCRARISWQYPIVELWTALIFITVPYAFIPVFCIYVIITIYDIRHKIIPDSLVYTSIFLSLTINLLNLSTYQTYSTLDWLAGPILFSFFASIWLISAGRVMGFGDAKLALSVGILLGFTQSVSAIVLSFWIGAAFGLLAIFWIRINPLIRINNKITMKSEIPFAPFIVIGAWFALMFHFDIIHASLF